MAYYAGPRLTLTVPSQPQFEDKDYVKLFKISPNLYTEDGARKHM